MRLSGWKKALTSAATEYLGKLGYRLTAVGYEYEDKGLPETAHGRGYSEPTFAAFYPNCQSVFGFHDAAPPAALRGVQYDVMGWYSDPNQDCLRALQRLKARKTAPDLSTVYRPGDITKEALKEGYQWEMSEDATAKGDPDQTVFYGCLTIETDTPPSFLRKDKPVTIAVGNTSSEALSAYLAQTLAQTGDISRLEELLEALHLASRLDKKS